jgi:hypothetical protein
VEKENKLFGEHKITQEEKSPTIKIAGACGKTQFQNKPYTGKTRGKENEMESKKEVDTRKICIGCE